MGVKQAPLEQVATSDIVIIGVVVDYFEEILRKIKPHLKPGSLVVDIASVKVEPVRLMEKLLPKDVEILATHPLFGPQSARNGIEGSKIVLCPVRTKRLVQIKKFIKNELKLDVLIRTPKEHDKKMAYILSLTHFIGRAICDLDIPFTHLSTQTYKHLLGIKGLIGKDSLKLYQSIQSNNPYSKSIRKKFLAQLEKIEKNTK